MLGTQYAAVGVLEIIWHHAYQDGDPRLGTAEDVEFMVGWDAQAGTCAAALVECGFLDADANGELSVHDLEDHAPDYVKARARKERQRKKSRTSHVTVTGDDRDCHPTPAPAPAPIHTSQKHSVRATFVQPTLDEVRAYCRERRNQVDAEAWMAFYESNGWKVGRNPMKDWRAAVRTWERNKVGDGKVRGAMKKLDPGSQEYWNAPREDQ
jgi:hypothetical protein